MSELFLTGMFRSGSTTLARALNAHQNIAFASDPYLEIMKHLRSDLAAEMDIKTPFMRPLGDYYYSDKDLILLEKIENALPSRKFDPTKWEALLPILKKRCGVYSESLVSHLENIKGATYQDVLTSGLQEIKNCYENDQTSITGFKEVWGVEFVPFFLECFPNSKSIILQRDPRAVCASKNKTEEKYPWLFLCKQWRKLAALGWSYAHNEKYSNRILLLNFEDFVINPEEETKKICDFLEIEWDKNIADASTYKGGGGETWKQNTSFGHGKANFDQNATQRWKQALSSEECAYIEYMCGPEMSLYGYETVETPQDDAGSYWIENSPRIDDESQANWMRELIPNNKDYLSEEMKKEKSRNDLLSLDNISEDQNLIKKSFLKGNVYQKLYQSKN